MSLTKRQQEVLTLMLCGLATKQIADKLGLTDQAIKHHRVKLMRRTNTKTSGQLCYWAAINGYRATEIA